MLIESNKSIKTKIRVFDFMATDLGLKLIKAKHAVNDESYRKKILWAVWAIKVIQLSTKYQAQFMRAANVISPFFDIFEGWSKCAV